MKQVYIKQLFQIKLFTVKEKCASGVVNNCNYEKCYCYTTAHLVGETILGLLQNHGLFPTVLPIFSVFCVFCP